MGVACAEPHPSKEPVRRPPPSCWSLSSTFWGTDLANMVTFPRPPALAGSPRAWEGCFSWHLDFSLLRSGCVCSRLM